MAAQETHRGLHITDLVALILVIVGGLNWGLVGLAEFNLVEAIFGFSMPLVRILYVIVGLGALYCAVRAPAMSHLVREPTTPPQPTA